MFALRFGCGSTALGNYRRHCPPQRTEQDTDKVQQVTRVDCPPLGDRLEADEQWGKGYKRSERSTVSSDSDSARFETTSAVNSTPASDSARAAAPSSGDRRGLTMRTAQEFFKAVTRPARTSPL